jgi:transcriptional/translational regulatory protein YebC/TACO1
MPLLRLLYSEALEDCDDIQNVYANFDVSDEVMAAID